MIHDIYHRVPNVSLDELNTGDYFSTMAISCPIDLDVARLRAEVQSIDPFAGTSKERTARKYGVIGANVTATKP